MEENILRKTCDMCGEKNEIHKDNYGNQIKKSWRIGKSWLTLKHQEKSGNLITFHFCSPKCCMNYIERKLMSQDEIAYIEPPKFPTDKFMEDLKKKGLLK